MAILQISHKNKIAPILTQIKTTKTTEKQPKTTGVQPKFKLKTTEKQAKLSRQSHHLIHQNDELFARTFPLFPGFHVPAYPGLMPYERPSCQQ